MKFISVDFLDQPIPKEINWLCRYFETPVRFAFLKYYIAFESIARFTQHTGFSCTIRYLKRMKKQYKILIKQHELAKKNFDFEKVASIEMGKEKLIY